MMNDELKIGNEKKLCHSLFCSSLIVHRFLFLFLNHSQLHKGGF